MTMPAQHHTSRRHAIKLLGGGAAMIGLGHWSAPVAAASTAAYSMSDPVIGIDVDSGMRTRISLKGRWLTEFAPSEMLRLVDNVAIDRFLLTNKGSKAVSGPHGAGTRHVLRGISDQRIEKTVTVTLFDRHPGFALMQVAYRNAGRAPVKLAGWTTASHVVAHGANGDQAAWTFAGSSHADRRDWVQPVAAAFDQRNFMGMNSSDYGGGTPVADVWRRDGGLAVGHVEIVPKLVAMPVTAMPGGTRIGIEGDWTEALAPGATIETPLTFIAAHHGDCYAPLASYGRVMAERGLMPPEPCEGCYEPIWCAWGYERNFTADQVIATLPKASELGFTWAVIDDGWQTSEGDWYLDPAKFPRGDADMKDMVTRIRAAGMKPKLWIAPLAVDPGTDLLRNDTDMLLLDEAGAVQDVTWWNAFYLCPAYEKTVENSKALVRKALGEWGFAGLKIDGQHLNGVAPCHNPAHKHTRPEESIEGLQAYWKALYDVAIGINPDAVVELCPCGTSYAFHNMVGHNQSVASDPLSSWQIRHKGKVIHALAGRHAAYSGDHVELSDGRDDFASTIGIGGVPSTKFTWPADTPNPTDTLPPGGFVLTKAKEAKWRKWIALYQQMMLPTGSYRGGLYDIGFDRPEGHAIEKDGVLHYSFYAEKFDGTVEFRGLAPGRYAIRDMWTGKTIGSIDAGVPRLKVAFDKFLLLAAMPEAQAAA